MTYSHKLAIVIPYFKIQYLELTLCSLAEQTCDKFKIYIGNDASPDDPTRILTKYSNQLEIVYKEFSENLGSISLTKHWDRCIKMIEREEWIMLLGDDDVLENAVVEKFYDDFHEFNGKTNIIRFATEIIDENSCKISNTYVHPKWESSTDSYFRRLTGKTRSSLSEYIFTETSYNKYKFYNYPLGWHSDDRAWLEFSSNKPIYSVNDVKLLIRYSKVSLSGKKDNVEQKILATNKHLQYIISQKLSSFQKNQRQVIIRIYESEISKTRKLSFLEWAYLFKLSMLNFKLSSVKGLMVKFVKAVIK